jgi:four helix bundle protein
MKSFEELDCWKKAASLRRRISALVKTFPPDEKYRLVDQMVRSSRSATAQIAEGFGRFHYQENIQFCRQARGSIFELIDHLITADEEKLISNENLAEIRFEIDNCLAVLNGYINYLVKAKLSHRVEEPAEVYAQVTDND